MAFGMRAKSMASVIALADDDDDDDESSDQSSTSRTKTGKKTSKTDKDAVETQQEEPPTPLDFDTFLPWVCMQWMVKEVVVVIRKRVEVFAPPTAKKKTGLRAKSKSKLDDEDEPQAMKSTVATPALELSKTEMEPPVMKFGKNVISVVTYYDSLDHLVEVSIINSPFKIPVEVFRAISTCLSYHFNLNKLTFRKGGLTAFTINAIGQTLLPDSKITEVCLDDSYVKEGNYYVLLDHGTHLKTLSLSRCRINDAIVEKIASRLKVGRPAAENLLTLDLSSNTISDDGACMIADVLRRNRVLLHLNLSGNRISDEGAKCIFNSLMTFPLTDTELYDLRCRRFQYYKCRQTVYDQYLKEQTKRRNLERLAQARKLTVTPKPQNKLAKKSSVLDVYDYAEMMTNQAMGETFVDVFDDNHLRRKGNTLCCTGNFRLVSLNLAYNNIEYPSLKIALQMLQHQAVALKSPYTGLIRLILEGNCLPHYCFELEMIQMYLKRIIVENVPVHVTKKRFSLKKEK